MGFQTSQDCVHFLHCLETYSSREAESLEDILEAFTRRHSISPAGVCLGIAGPVVRGRSKTTNLPWTVSETGLRKRFGWERGKLINDLSATALSVPLLPRERLRFLNRARAEQNGTIGVVAPGTGLGQALLVFEDGRPRAVPSEGGHVDFVPNSEAGVELWRFLQAKYGHVSVERVLSGNGLVNIYTWLQQAADSPEPTWLAEKIPVRVIPGQPGSSAGGRFQGAAAAPGQAGVVRDSQIFVYCKSLEGL